ncbi:MAG: glycosyltransferase family 9 protein [Chloroflexi bacterium]|nr:glycosyltransferase family 9 protein [Chloroflexota bacterium]
MIGVLRLGAIGDTLLAASALLALRCWQPTARIGLVARGDVGRVLHVCGVVDEVEDVDGPLGAWLVGAVGAALPAARLSPLAAPDLAVVWRRQGGEEVAGRWATLGARHTHQAPSLPPPETRQHVADHLLGTLAPLGIARPPGPLALPHRAALVERGRAIVVARGLRRRAFVLHPGSGGPTKRWPPASFAALGRALEQHGDVVLLGGPADAEAVAAVLDAAGRAWPALRQAPLADVGALLAVAAAYVGNDSGPSHLAALVGCPTVALYGPTDPAVWGARGPRARSLLPPGVDLAGWRPAAVADIPPAAVLDALRDLRILAVP